MEIRLALDWTPNPIHSGIFLARAKGWFRELGIDVHLVGVEEDAYSRTTLDKLLAGECNVAIMPSELLMTVDSPVLKPVAIATLLQGNSSCFAAKGEIRPGQTIRYAALDLPFEREFVKQLWPEAEFTTPSKLDIYQLLFENQVDLAWLFRPIEGIEAELKGIPLKYYSLEEASIPYGHAPLMVTSWEFLSEKSTELKRFLEVCSRGYHYTASNLQETLEILFALNISGMRDRNLLKAQLNALTPYWLNEMNQWGMMNPERWLRYYHWLQRYAGFQLPDNEITTLFTNDFLKQSVIKA